jgi:hypothetical protein
MSARTTQAVVDLQRGLHISYSREDAELLVQLQSAIQQMNSDYTITGVMANQTDDWLDAWVTGLSKSRGVVVLVSLYRCVSSLVHWTRSRWGVHTPFEMVIVISSRVQHNIFLLPLSLIQTVHKGESQKTEQQWGRLQRKARPALRTAGEGGRIVSRGHADSCTQRRGSIIQDLRHRW